MALCSSKVDTDVRGKRCSLRQRKTKGSRRKLVVLIGLLMLGVLLSLGSWQLQRAEEKQRWLAESTQHRLGDGEIDRIAPALQVQRWQPVRLLLEWLPRPPLLLDNRTDQGRAGYEVLMPAKMADGRIVTVNLGWIAAPPLRSEQPRLPGLEGAAVQSALAGLPPKTYLLSLAADESWRVQRIDLPVLQEYWDVALVPWVLWLEQPVESGIRARVPIQQQLPPERHLGYAVQWFGLALVLLIAGVVFYRRYG